jgi:glycosyltransferase involved in cell wall biosynthesis
MDSHISKEIALSYKIVYFTNGYRPDCEGVSRELRILCEHFSQIPQTRVFMHDLADHWRFGLKRNFVSYPDRLLPLGYPLLKYLERTADLVHIYGSVTGRLYLKLINKKPSILTSTSALIRKRLEQCAPAWKSFDVIVLESERDLHTLRQAGLDPVKIRLIYPGVPMHNIPPPPDNIPFTILFASAPIAKDPRSLRRRGVNLLIKAAMKLQDCRFIFLWRRKHIRTLRQMLSEANLSNIKVIDKIVPGIESLLHGVHATILSPEDQDDCKPCPYSLIESLACTRPVLASNQVGISDLIEKETCGIVFSPDPDDIADAVHKMQNSYENYRKNTSSTVLKYFSTKKFLQSYNHLYRELGLLEN